MAWSLAKRGIKVAVIERASFPREKVCGDFVEPGGLRILAAMGCLQMMDGPARLPITANRVYFGPKLAYRGEIPYYQNDHGLPPHGYIIPRNELDTHLLVCAQAASATVMQASAVVGVRREGGLMRVDMESDTGNLSLTSRLVIGADGAESTVAKSVGLRRTDRRYIGISQRAYVEGIETKTGEAAIWFEEDIFPGYGWMFPIGNGRANVGVGILSETCHRHGLSVPQSFTECIKRLRIRHPDCANAHVISRPLGGVVKTYGGIDRNHFDGGLLIGDAGSFVDPMTGEGITQGMESALIATSTVVDALERGRFDAGFLSRFDTDFHDYFDPAMQYLDLNATFTRNWHFREFFLSTSRRGFEVAQNDPDFARVAGSTFGGLNLQPLLIIGQMWSGVLKHAVGGGVQAFSDLLGGRVGRSGGLMADMAAWERGWSASIKHDAAWHFSWLKDVVKKSVRLQTTLWNPENPRVRGPLL